ncbi:MAG: sigma-70 family RNA polymerase sigma factor [bacterium]
MTFTDDHKLDAQLASAAKHDTEAFAELYEKYVRRIYAFIRYRISATNEEVEDLVAEVFMKVVDKLGQFDDTKGNFASWLFTIAGNHLRDRFRKKTVSTVSLDDTAELPSGDKPQLQQLLQQDERQRLQEAISTLPEREQELIALKYGSGYNNRQIAEIVGLSSENVGVILFRSLKLIRSLVQTSANSAGLPKEGGNYG